MFDIYVHAKSKLFKLSWLHRGFPSRLLCSWPVKWNLSLNELIKQLGIQCAFLEITFACERIVCMNSSQCVSTDIVYIYFYYIRLYFTVFLLARSNTRDIPFSNILISKKQFLCNKKHIAFSCHVISFIDFARECNMIIYCKKNGMSRVLLLANRKIVK